MEFTQVNMPKCLLLPEVFPVFNFIQLQSFNSSLLIDCHSLAHPPKIFQVSLTICQKQRKRLPSAQVACTDRAHLGFRKQQAAIIISKLVGWDASALPFSILCCSFCYKVMFPAQEHNTTTQFELHPKDKQEIVWPSGQDAELVIWWSWVQVLHPAIHQICSWLL